MKTKKQNKQKHTTQAYHIAHTYGCFTKSQLYATYFENPHRKPSIFVTEYCVVVFFSSLFFCCCCLCYCCCSDPCIVKCAHKRIHKQNETMWRWSLPHALTIRVCLCVSLCSNSIEISIASIQATNEQRNPQKNKNNNIISPKYMFWFPLLHSRCVRERVCLCVWAYTQRKLSIVVARLRRCLCVPFIIISAAADAVAAAAAAVAAADGVVVVVVVNSFSIFESESHTPNNSNIEHKNKRRRTIITTNRDMRASAGSVEIYRLRARWKENKYGSLSIRSTRQVYCTPRNTYGMALFLCLQNAQHIE